MNQHTKLKGWHEKYLWKFREILTFVKSDISFLVIFMHKTKLFIYRKTKRMLSSIPIPSRIGKEHTTGHLANVAIAAI